MAKAKPKPKYVGNESLGESLHTALRKCCDSKPTTAAYLCISLLPNDLWGEYLKVVGEYLDTQKKNLQPDTAGKLLKYVVEADVYDPGRFYVEERDLSRTDLEKLLQKVTVKNSLPPGKGIEEIITDRRRWRELFKAVLETFTDDDWEGYACFLFSEGA